MYIKDALIFDLLCGFNFIALFFHFTELWLQVFGMIALNSLILLFNVTFVLRQHVLSSLVKGLKMPFEFNQ